jgi:hypothetical protein
MGTATNTVFARKGTVKPLALKSNYRYSVKNR